MEFQMFLTDEELEILKKRQIFRMNWIQSGMDEKEPLDMIIQRVVNCAQRAKDLNGNE